MIGQTISHYKIIEKLGEGGMGVVYRAEDTRLKRTVALKFLPPDLTRDPEANQRFMQEAQAASALDHANICTIYEIDETADGQLFISMAFYDGETVREKIDRGPLELDETIDVAIQVAEGLQEAHQKGIVHRDIKPANIMVTFRGRVKIMDFGLAKLTGQTKLTRAGTTVGTAAYMSPEQARGEGVDHRTDIWSLGVVLYEMLTGALPFKGEYEQAVIYSILNEDPESMACIQPGIPGELDRLVNKTLAKLPAERYQTIDDLLTDLRKVKRALESSVAKESSSEPSRPSIAVLPFADLSPGKDQEYFCDGMAEEIINALAHVESLRVVARTSAFAFKGKCEDIREIGRKLNVKTLLEGSVRKAGNRLRIVTQLVNVADGYHLWSERYDREMEDVFAIQDEISLAIVDKLRVKLLGREKAKLMKRHTEHLDAYNLYLKGRYFFNKRTEESLKKGMEYFQRATENDPTYALAYTGLADSYTTLPDYTPLPPKEAYSKAKKAALKALEIDNMLAEAHASLGHIKRAFESDWEGAEREFLRAIELNPGSATAHHFYAYYLMSMARFDQGIAEMKRACELDPLSLAINRNLGQLFCFARQYDQAIEQLQKTIEMDPNFSYAHLLLGLAYGQKSMYKEALTELQKEKVLSGSWDTVVDAWFAIIYAVMGKREKAQEVLDDLVKRSKQEYVPSYALASVYFALGENDQGFKWLYRAYEERDIWLRDLIKIDPWLDSVRSDPRFKALLKKMGLEK